MIGKLACKLWLESSLFPMQYVFLFVLAYACLEYPGRSLNEQLEYVDNVSVSDVIRFAKLHSIKHETAGAYYSRAIIATFLAKGDKCCLRSLQLIAEAVKQVPMSARYGYAFAILHRRCNSAIDVATEVWNGVESKMDTTLFFRRVVASAYERNADLHRALLAFEYELVKGQWEPQLIRVLTKLFVEKVPKGELLSCWRDLDLQYPASQTLSIEALFRTVQSEMTSNNAILFWRSIQIQSGLPAEAMELRERNGLCQWMFVFGFASRKISR
jgi:hypothetical protein